MCTRYFIESDLQSALETVKQTPLTAWMQEAFDKRVTILYFHPIVTAKM